MRAAGQGGRGGASAAETGGVLLEFKQAERAKGGEGAGEFERQGRPREGKELEEAWSSTIGAAEYGGELVAVK